MRADRCWKCGRARAAFCRDLGRPCPSFRPIYAPQPRRFKQRGDTPLLARTRRHWQKRYAQMVGA